MNYFREISGLNFDEIHALGIREAESLCTRIYEEVLGHVNGYKRMIYSNVYIYLKEIEKRSRNRF